jgi:antitoxin component of MazEF toxin-antitoxin module
VTKTISKFGESQGVILFDDVIMELARVKVGDQMDITVMSDSGAIVLTPLRKGPSRKRSESGHYEDGKVEKN